MVWGRMEGLEPPFYIHCNTFHQLKISEQLDQEKVNILLMQ